jgi:hypothetical protein
MTTQENLDLVLLDAAHIEPFTKGGRALFTVVSKKTGQRFTFRIQRKNHVASGPLFVKVLTGSQNDSDYTFLGTIFDDRTYVRSKKSPIGPDAPSALAFDWFWRCIQAQKLTSFDVYHHGRCCRCGRTLTVPSSIQLGIGPECASKGA